MKLFAILTAFMLSLSMSSAEPDARARGEIEHLMSFLAGSSCEFYRNGSWHAPARAVEHLRGKYEYLAGRGLVSTAESFIERAATESSMSGKPYLVRCGDAESVESAKWFSEELSRYRAKAK
jgi:Family of unknown function (DUF5329)